ncbi:MAG: DNA polymerase III subunit delta [Gammaproteobacteria bacterium]
MRIDTEQLAQHLQRALAPLYTVHGQETLLALEAADRIRQQARAQGYSEREVLIAEAGFDWSQLAMSANSLSLFGSRRILELRVPSGKPGTEGAEALKRFASDLPADTVALVSLPRLDRATLASGWFEALEQAGLAVAANAVAPARLPQWLAGRLRQQGQETDGDTLALLAGMVEGNLLAAQQELQKLALLFPPGKLTREGVESAVLDVARYDVFKLGETLLAGDPARVVRVLEGLKGEGAAPPLVLWAIAEELHALWRVSAAVAAGKPLQLALREARVWGPRAELLPRALRHMHGRELQAALLAAADVDRTIKGLTRGDAWEELLRLALGLAGSQARNRGRMNA